MFGSMILLLSNFCIRSHSVSYHLFYYFLYFSIIISIIEQYSSSLHCWHFVSPPSFRKFLQWSTLVSYLTIFLFGMVSSSAAITQPSFHLGYISSISCSSVPIPCIGFSSFFQQFTFFIVRTDVHFVPSIPCFYIVCIFRSLNIELNYWNAFLFKYRLSRKIPVLFWTVLTRTS